MTSRAQLACIMALTTTLLLALTTAACWHFAQVQHLQLASERNHFLLNSLRKTAEIFLSTGMTPEQMPAMQDVIDREKASFVQIMSIDLFTPTGRITYSTDPGSFNAQVPHDWVAQLTQPDAWETQDPTQDQLGMRFENNMGRAAGGIVLTLMPEQGPKTLAQWRQSGTLALQWLLLLCLSVLAAVLLGLWQLKRSLRPYQQISLALVQRQTRTTDLTRPHAPLLNGALQMAQKLEQEYAQTEQAMRQLQELDHAN